MHLVKYSRKAKKQLDWKSFIDVLQMSYRYVRASLGFVDLRTLTQQVEQDPFELPDTEMHSSYLPCEIRLMACLDALSG